MKAEELALGIGEKFTTDWRDELGWPPSNDIEEMNPDDTFELCSRKRANSKIF
jgi:hypothetical protein